MGEDIKLEEIIDLYNELQNRECGDSWFLKYDGTKYDTDTRYAFEGIEIFIEEIKHKLERSCYFEEVPAQALENLIKGYRELEYKYNKALTDLSIETKRTNEENYRCSLFAVENNDLKEKLADSIPKSQIKSKIEELDKQRIKMEKDDIGVGFTLGNNWSDLKAKIQVLQELMEDK